MKKLKEMKNKVLFSSKSTEWETPEKFFNELNKEFDFTLDPSCTKKTAKCKRYYTIKENGLIQDWKNERVFCNPPYARGVLDKWVKKCYEEKNKAEIIIMLIPARTDTIYFHNYIYHIAEIKFIKGRLKFVGAKNGAPFPSMLVIYRRNKWSKK